MMDGRIRVWRDMMERVQYDIRSDCYIVRYGWSDKGQPKTFLADPILATDIPTDHDLTGAISVRRIACLKHRGIE